MVDALTTLAFDYYTYTNKRESRKRFFTAELENLFLLSREQNQNPVELTGSYAGAMGWGQFMPSSYRAYAVDFDNDQFADIWNNPIDAIGRHAPPLRARNRFCNVISRGGLFKPNQRIKDAGPHRRPLLACPRHSIAGSVGERVSGRQGVGMDVTSHGDETRRIAWPLQAGRRIRRRRAD